MYDQIQKAQPKKIASIIKYLNIITGAMIIAFGFVGLFFMAIMNILTGKIFLIFSPIFQMIFGAILIATQFKLPFIRNNFAFLNELIGRGVFNLYLASSVFFYFHCGNGNTILAWVSSMILFGIGIIYILLHFGVGSKIKQAVI